MESDDFLHNLNRPEVAAPQHQQHLRMTLLNTRKTAALSVWLVAVPCFFLFCVAMKTYFGLNAHILDTFAELFQSLDRSPQGWWLNPLLFFVLPLLTVALNLLALLHIDYSRNGPKLLFRVQLTLKFWNVLLLTLGLFVVLVVLGYLFSEHFQQRL